jgi:hypothetical protein
MSCHSVDGQAWDIAMWRFYFGKHAELSMLGVWNICAPENIICSKVEGFEFIRTSSHYRVFKQCLEKSAGFSGKQFF